MGRVERHMKAVYTAPQEPGSFTAGQNLRKALKKKGHTKITPPQVEKWLRTQDSYTLHRQVRPVKRDKIQVSGIDDQWQADLVGMLAWGKENQGHRYLLTCIDVFSKFAWAIPIKSKNAPDVVRALKAILKGKRKPRCLQTDKGSEFLNQSVQAFLRRKNIHFFTSQNSKIKCGVVERFNKTLKNKMWKYFTFVKKKQYLKVLPKLISSYNHTPHRSIGCTPAQVTRKNEEKIWLKLYGTPLTKYNVPKFQVGDTVRKVLQKHNPRSNLPLRGYMPRWSEQVFVVHNIQPNSHPVRYVIRDHTGHVLRGTFYEQQLQKVQQEWFQVEKVLAQRKVKRQTEILVKWKGYSEAFNSWIPKKSVK